MGTKKRTPDQNLAEINHILNLIAENKRDTNLELIKKARIEQSRFYILRNKLMRARRINKKRIVLNSKPISMAEFEKLGPVKRYKKSTSEKRKGVKKTIKKEIWKLAKEDPDIYLPPRISKTYPVIKNPVELPVLQHKSGAEITIKVSVEDIGKLLYSLIAKGGE